MGIRAAVQAHNKKGEYIFYKVEPAASSFMSNEGNSTMTRHIIQMTPSRFVDDVHCKHS